MRKASCNLGSCFLCQHCLPEWKELVAVKKETYHFRKGEMIFREGDMVKGIYFLYSGGVKVHKQWVDQKELIIRFTREGDILGHRGFGAGESYPVSATALTESKACFISNSFLETTLRADHAFTYRLMQVYAEELQKAETRMRNLAHMDVKGRIAVTLLELKEAFGLDRNKHIAVPVTRQDIASYSGTTYETVFRILKSLTTEKFISATGKSIRIHNEKRLRLIVEQSR